MISNKHELATAEHHRNHTLGFCRLRTLIDQHRAELKMTNNGRRQDLHQLNLNDKQMFLHGGLGLTRSNFIFILQILTIISTTLVH